VDWNWRSPRRAVIVERVFDNARRPVSSPRQAGGGVRGVWGASAQELVESDVTGEGVTDAGEPGGPCSFGSVVRVTGAGGVGIPGRVERDGRPYGGVGCCGNRQVGVRMAGVAAVARSRFSPVRVSSVPPVAFGTLVRRVADSVRLLRARTLELRRGVGPAVGSMLCVDSAAQDSEPVLRADYCFIGIATLVVSGKAQRSTPRWLSQGSGSIFLPDGFHTSKCRCGPVD